MGVPAIIQKDETQLFKYPHSTFKASVGSLLLITDKCCIWDRCGYVSMSSNILMMLEWIKV